MNTGCYRLYRMSGYNPVTAWVNAHAKFVGLVGSFAFGLMFWTLVILWLTE